MHFLYKKNVHKEVQISDTEVRMEIMAVYIETIITTTTTTTTIITSVPNAADSYSSGLVLGVVRINESIRIVICTFLWSIRYSI